MVFLIDSRPSKTASIEQVWSARSIAAGSFMSIASCHWEIVFGHNAEGRACVTVRGPETRPTRLYHPAPQQWWGIRLGLQSRLGWLPFSQLIDGAVTFIEGNVCRDHPAARLLRISEPDHAEAAMHDLERHGSFVVDDAMMRLLTASGPDLSIRTAQRRFHQATGLDRRSVHQIERARYAHDLLRSGTSALDTAFQAGYFDQAHLCRSLKRWTGQTPGQITADT